AGFAAVVASGAIGFLLSVIHHALVGWVYHYLGLGFRYRRIIDSLKIKKHLQIRDLSDKELPIWRWLPGREWTLVTALWHERAESSPRIKGATPRAQSLADLAHSLGAAFAGSMLALVLALLVLGSLDQLRAFWTVSLVLVFLHFLSYWRTVRIARNFIGILLLQEFCEPLPPSPTPPEELVPGQPPDAKPWIIHFPCGKTLSPAQPGQKQEQERLPQVTSPSSCTPVADQICGWLQSLERKCRARRRHPRGPAQRPALETN